MREDYYQLLDVPLNAPQREIKAAYHRQALRCHPDRNADNPAAEERFKLVAEAYRTLGVPERRREYDDWLHLHNRYQAAPELAEMSGAARVKPFHYSSRRAEARQRERREGREGRRVSRRGEAARVPRRRVTLFSRSGKVNTWLFLGFYVMLALNLVPMLFRQLGERSPRVVKRAVSAPVEQVSVPEARRRVLQMEADLLRRAEAGDAQAQYQLGLYCFNKSSRGRGGAECPGVLRRAASEAYRRQAVEWFSRAAAQGHEAAGRLMLRFSSSGSSLP